MNNAHDFSEVAIVSYKKPGESFVTSFQSNESLINTSINSTLEEVKLLDKEAKIKKVLYQNIRNHFNEEELEWLNEHELDLFMDVLALSLAKVV